jgi:hypothetical protein
VSNDAGNERAREREGRKVEYRMCRVGAYLVVRQRPRAHPREVVLRRHGVAENIHPAAEG